MPQEMGGAVSFVSKFRLENKFLVFVLKLKIEKNHSLTG
jgi:hypothetical protein